MKGLYVTFAFYLGSITKIRIIPANLFEDFIILEQKKSFNC